MGWKAKIGVGLATIVAVIGAAELYVRNARSDRPVSRLPVAGRLVLANATVVDVRDGRLLPGRTVLMDGGQIVSVTSGQGPSPDRGARVVDAAGLYVVPGYNDMHAHALGLSDPSGALALMLANGVTGFRQMHGSDAMLAERRESRLPIGPDTPAPLAIPGQLLTPLNAGGVDQALVTVRAQKAAGADFIKVGLVSRPVLFAVLAEAGRLNLPVAGHVPASADVVAAALGGMRAIEHLGPADGVLVACSARRAALRRELDALPAMGGLPFRSALIEKLADAYLERLIVNPASATTPDDTRRRAIVASSFDEARCRRVARALKRTGNWQSPTLIRLKTTQFADAPALSTDPNQRYMPPETVESWREATDDYLAKVPADARALFRKTYALDLRAVKIFDEEGVPMLAGSDESGGWEVPGFSLHQEFGELAAAGLSPLRVLQMTTIDPARFLGRTGTMGLVAPGRAADLVLLTADPTRDVRNLRRIAGVIRAGRYYDAAALAALKRRVQAGGGYLR